MLAATERTFISAVEAARLLDIDARTFKRFADRFSTLTLPGNPPRFRRSEVIAFRDQHTKPAPTLAGVTS